MNATRPDGLPRWYFISYGKSSNHCNILIFKSKFLSFPGTAQDMTIHILQKIPPETIPLLNASIFHLFMIYKTTKK